MNKIYRPNVAIVVVNDTGNILACRRSDRAHIWQIPQGGIDKGETPEQAMLRELEEEIGSAEVEIIARLPQTIRYDWPEELFSRGYHGQEQTYFLVRLKHTAKIDFSLSTEFTESKWIPAQEFLAQVSGFKKEPYTTGITGLIKLSPEAFNK